MTRDVLFASVAVRDFGRLPVDARRQIRDGLTEFAASHRGAVKVLRGVEDGEDLCRLRIGEYRVVFDDDGSRIRVTGIFRRSP